MSEEIRRRWRNWSGEQRCRPLRIARPRTREGLILALIEANEAERRIKVAGSGHSFTGAALTDGTMVQIDLLDRILELDRPSGLVKVEAGIGLGELNRRLDQRGLALESLGDIDRQTLAGSISTATHGTGKRFRNLSSQVVSMELVGADGTLRELSERSDPEGWRAARVGIGALGAIYSVTLQTVTNFRIDRTDRARPLADVLAGLDGFVDELDHFEFYVFPHTETALCRESMRTQVPARPPSPAATYAQEVVLENWIAGAFVQVARHVPAAIPTLSRMAAAGTGKARRIDQSYRVYASERRVKFTEMEYAIPRADAREAVERVLEIAARPEFEVCFPIEVRFVAGDDALLSPAHERDSCYIAVHHDRHGDWQPYFEAVAAVMASYGGRPHWGKRHKLGAAELSRLYPRFDDFKAIRGRLDPDGRFANPYTEQVLGPVVVPSKRRRGADSEEGVALAAVGRRLGDDLVAGDEVEPVEALAELARLGVAHVDAIADPEPHRDLAEQRRLHLAGALVAIEVEAGGQPGLRAAGRRPPGPRRRSRRRARSRSRGTGGGRSAGRSRRPGAARSGCSRRTARGRRSPSRRPAR